MSNVTGELLASPITFLSRVPCSCAARFIGLRRMNVQLILDEDTGVARILPTPGGEAGALFYVLGWSEQQASVGTLGNGARFFFTGPLSGCTFAVDRNWYTPRVIHVNETLQSGAMNVNGMMHTVDTQMALCTSLLKPWKTGPNITVVQSHNRPEDYTYNIFGYLTGGGWNFYQQEIETVGLGTKVVRALRELDTWF